MQQDVGITEWQKVGQQGWDDSVKQFSIQPPYLVFLLFAILLSLHVVILLRLFVLAPSRHSAGGIGTYVRMYKVCIFRNVHVQVMEGDNSITLTIYTRLKCKEMKDIADQQKAGKQDSIKQFSTQLHPAYLHH